MTAKEAAALAERAERVLRADGLDPAAVVRVLAPQVLGIWVCRKCGCTDISACDEGCFWVEDDLCSACVSGREEGPECIST